MTIQMTKKCGRWKQVRSSGRVNPKASFEIHSNIIANTIIDVMEMGIFHKACKLNSFRFSVSICFHVLSYQFYLRIPFYRLLPSGTIESPLHPLISSIGQSTLSSQWADRRET